MVWFRVDDKIGEHPKVRAIPRSKRRNAMGLWVLAGAWSSLNLRDGHIPGYMIEDLCCKLTDAAELARVGLWHATAHGCTECDQPRDADGFIFHDWASLQFTRERVLEKRQADAERQAEWRERKKQEQNGKSQARDVVTETDEAVSNGSVPLSRPVPSRPVPLVEEIGGQRQETLDPSRARCTAHQGVESPPDCRGCMLARQAVEREIANLKAEARRVIAECTRCDEYGRTLDPITNLPTGRCNHLRSVS